MKRFYKLVTVETGDDGFIVLLDGRTIKTPLRAELILPTQAVADAVAAEWQAQGEDVEADKMPMTRYATTSIDRVKTDRPEVNEIVAAYAGHDLLCYRADEANLRQVQDDQWQPLLDWAAQAFDTELIVTSGIVSVEQPQSAMDRLKSRVVALSDGELAALHILTSLTGSLILALAVALGEIDVDQAWQAAIVDETFQAEKWGQDNEAEQRHRNMRVELEAAYRYFSLCQS